MALKNEKKTNKKRQYLVGYYRVSDKDRLDSIVLCGSICIFYRCNSE